MMKRAENVVVEKTEAFADRIVKMYQYLHGKRQDNVDMLKQIVRCGTSVGANTAESQYAQSKADFLTKLSIALKEANETKFWLNRLYAANYLTEQQYASMMDDNVEIIKLLTSITKTVKSDR